MRLTRAVSELFSCLDACEQMVDALEAIEIEEPLRLILKESRDSLTNLYREFSQQHCTLRLAEPAHRGTGVKSSIVITSVLRARPDLSRVIFVFEGLPPIAE